MKKYLLALFSFLIISGSGFAQCPGTSLQAGIIGTDQTVCMGSTPAPIMQITQPTNVTGFLTYSWQQSSSISGPWTTISSATNASYTPMPLINTTYFRRVDTDQGAAAPCNVATSNPVTIRVSNINPGTIGTDQTVCYNTIPVPFTEITAASNLTGTPTYTWEVSSSNILGSFVTIPGATNTSYTPPIALTKDVYIRRIVTDPTKPAPCNTATSNTVHITVLPQLTAGTIAGDQIICAGAMPAPFTSTSLPTGGSGTYSYQWQADESGTILTIAGATNATYTHGMPITTTTKFQRVETSGTCASVISNIVTVTTTTPETVTVSLNDPGPICPSASPITFTAIVKSTDLSTINYQWYLETKPVGNNSATYSYTPQSSDNGKIVKVVATTSDACNTGPATATVTLLVVDPVTPSVSIYSYNNPTCEGFPLTFSASSIAAGKRTYKWYVNNTPASTSPTSVFTSANLTNGDEVWVEMTLSEACAVGINSYASNKIKAIIKPIPNSTINEPDQTICAGASFTFTSSGTSVIPETKFRWATGSPANPIIIPGATNNTYTATKAGDYFIIEDNGTCNASGKVVTLTIDPCGGFSTSISGPNPITAGQQNAVYSVFNQAGFTYEWSITGGTIVSGQNTNSVTVDWDAPAIANARTTASTYSISVKETNPSKQSKTTTLNVNEITTGVTKSLAQSGITLFPNPAAESFSIEMPESGVAVHYEIVDLTGVSVAQGNFISTGNAEKITADFGAGMYQVILHYNNTVTCGKLSKVQ